MFSASVTNQSVQIPIRWGISWSAEKIIVPIDGRFADLFGISVSLQSGKLVLDASQVDCNGINNGAVYIYELNGSTWIFKKMHTPPNDEMGLTLKLDGIWRVLNFNQILFSIRMLLFCLNVGDHLREMCSALKEYCIMFAC